MSTEQRASNLCRVDGCRNKWRLATNQLCRKHQDHDLAHVPLARKPKSCTVPGCLNQVLAPGRCSTHQYELYKQLDVDTLLELERIMVAWIVPDEDGCWIWHGRKKDGYGQLIVNGRWISVHRWLYMHLVGPIPDGYHMHHECEKPLCVRPGHLAPLTPEKHREITEFSRLMFNFMPSAVLGIDNVSHTDKERMFAGVYNLPSDLDVVAIPEMPYLSGKH